mmetsp:Transcript_22010/g.50214  ORF Transcript_22010/g.50214 Transcript_22010/m.50214 type:complete len:154 (-) Transcript_22010:270-731(-)
MGPDAMHEAGMLLHTLVRDPPGRLPHRGKPKTDPRPSQNLPQNLLFGREDLLMGNASISEASLKERLPVTCSTLEIRPETLRKLTQFGAHCANPTKVQKQDSREVTMDSRPEAEEVMPTICTEDWRDVTTDSLTPLQDFATCNTYGITGAYME